jgi:hypothetical protein
MKKHPNNTALIRQNTYYVYETKIGKITIANNGAAITAVYLGVKEDLGEYFRTALTDEKATTPFISKDRGCFSVDLV